MSIPAKPRVVILRPSGLGDLLTVVPALRGIARAYPGHHRVLLAPAWLKEVVQLIDLPGGPGLAIDEVIDHRGLTPLPPEQERQGAEVSVNLEGRGPSSHALLFPLRARRTIAFHHPTFAPDGPEWRTEEHDVARWCRMLRAHDISATAGELFLTPPAQPLPAGWGEATIVHPGANDITRRWPADRWARIARSEQEAGRPVVITGNADERRLAEQVASAAGVPQDRVLAGRTSLSGLTSLLAGVGRLVSGDTGVAHLASALGTPSVLLFGPHSPNEWGPPAGPRHVVLWSGEKGHPDHRDVDPGLMRIHVEQVTQALQRLPARAGR